MNPALATLIDEVLELAWRFSPATASLAGIHRYDDRLADRGPDAIADYQASIAGHLRELDSLLRAGSALSDDEELDAGVLERALRVEARLLEEVRPAFRDPAHYLDEIFYSAYCLVQREFAPLPERARSLARRLGDVPRLLSQATGNLVDAAIIPEGWVEAAAELARGCLSFLREIDLSVAPRSGAAERDLRCAVVVASAAIEEYGRFIGEQLAGRTTGDFAIGRELYDFLLRTQHGLDFDAESLSSYGTDLVATTRESLLEASRTVDPARSLQELVAGWKGDHPTAGTLVAEYSRIVERAREFVKRRRIATIPDGEKLHIVATPAFQRSICPYAAYVMAGPFEETQDGVFWVTPPPDDADPAESEARLQGHPRLGMVVTAVHEAYPGHHLQLCVANRIPSKIRRHFMTSVTVEGWAFYCEQLMAEQGFYDDPRTGVLHLKDQLWRACRVVIDAGLQTRSMTREQAVQMLNETAQLEPSGARGEVLRYIRSATQPMSYAVGKEEILRLRDECRRRSGESFDLGKFHDEFLSFGSIPVAMIRKRMIDGSAPGRTEESQ